jgi:uncharacterized protein (TIGR03032 family)
VNPAWAREDGEWRDVAQVASQWKDAAETHPDLLHHRVTGRFWEALAACEITLLVTREYEHLVMALTTDARGGRISYMRLPHPSGIAVDQACGLVYLASTRNPNQVFELSPVTQYHQRPELVRGPLEERVLFPIRSHYLPGCTYLHDLAIIGGTLHGNAVGRNAIVRLLPDRAPEPVWWPRCVDANPSPLLDRNHIQLNSIAAGINLTSSYFTASTDRVSARRPGHANFPVDGRGVLFSGATREPVARGLTRPHSARLHDGRVWLDNSGYGELGYAEDGTFRPLLKLAGWTRGLYFSGNTAFVGTSRVLPRFRQYAPGLSSHEAICGVHAVDVNSGRILGSLVWPSGNQIFAIEGVPARTCSGFPFRLGARKRRETTKGMYYAFASCLAWERQG